MEDRTATTMEVNEDYVHFVSPSFLAAHFGDESMATKVCVSMPETAVIDGMDVHNWVFVVDGASKSRLKGSGFRHVLLPDPVELLDGKPEPKTLTVRAQALKDAFTAAYCRFVLGKDIFPDK